MQRADEVGMEGERSTGDWGGPYLQVAAFCERVLHEVDGVLTPVRLVDRFLVPVFDPPELGPPPQPVRTQLLIALKAGKAQGRHTVRIQMMEPSGLLRDPTDVDILLEGEDRGANLVVPVEISSNEEGLYWLSVTLQDRTLTRMPLRIVHQLVRLASVSTGPAP